MEDHRQLLERSTVSDLDLSDDGYIDDELASDGDAQSVGDSMSWSYESPRNAGSIGGMKEGGSPALSPETPDKISLALRQAKEEVSASKSRFLAPHEIGFTSSSIASKFRDGRSIASTLLKLVQKKIKKRDVRRCAVVLHEGRYYSMSNRRLAIYRLLESLGRCGKIKVEVMEKTDKWRRAFTTTCKGEYVFIRNTGEIVGSSPDQTSSSLLQLHRNAMFRNLRMDAKLATWSTGEGFYGQVTHFAGNPDSGGSIVVHQLTPATERLADVSGRVLLVFRHSLASRSKYPMILGDAINAVRAQSAGAVGLIVASHKDDRDGLVDINDPAETVVAELTIPTCMVSHETGKVIAAHVLAGEGVWAQIVDSSASFTMSGIRGAQGAGLHHEEDLRVQNGGLRAEEAALLERLDTVRKMKAHNDQQLHAVVSAREAEEAKQKQRQEELRLIEQQRRDKNRLKKERKGQEEHGPKIYAMCTNSTEQHLADYFDRTVKTVALGKEGCMLLYEDGETSWCDVPLELANKLKGRSSKLPKPVFVCLGPERGYFFVKFADGKVHYRVPDSLAERFSTYKGRNVAKIALGPKGSWYVRWEDITEEQIKRYGRYISEESKNLPRSLKNMLSSNGHRKVEEISISGINHCDKIDDAVWFLKFQRTCTKDAWWKLGGQPPLNLTKKIDEVQDNGGRICAIEFGKSGDWVLRYSDF